MEITLHGRIIFTYGDKDIDEVLSHAPGDIYPSTDREKERIIKAHATREAHKLDDSLVLSRAIFSLPKRARIIFTQARNSDD